MFTCWVVLMCDKIIKHTDLLLYSGTNATLPMFSWNFTQVSSIYLHYQCAENNFFPTEQTIYKILYVQLKQQDNQKDIHIYIYGHNGVQGPVGPLLHISSWRSIKTLKLIIASICFDSYCMDFNVGVGICTVKWTVIPIRKITGSSCCSCLHFCKSLDKRYPRKDMSTITLIQAN
jgi:hypothetical protein